ncbi:MAG: carboxypeptidase regulatory-like domain-containing protein [Vicinamibacterales bacterium]|mgnify:FL=1|jgi:hypothetical protein|nr:hypothetical protein [Acidobacteriota bacterium]MDP7294531.1 carboxypeptidase regulatory-like domain-containing protein [Vicinamibacterales bacterium]MDP7471566.1 carboxypeptidase regulatory-like domain-containing protein [Vicinamibacterales bacterium]MDP7672289.1 carboxypeptidase regulatory-like domain-containing protein [Vicinamibacterales bacterium]HJO37918.1 carboxypeptidase regulatory-like domain-containing protein [Vicinamibacterales bacterium]|tara:strand:- start:3089 stop:3946 length:858 start_codon:yes stop_codon:yes gene_type:complete
MRTTLETRRLVPLLAAVWLVLDAGAFAQTRVVGMVRDENSEPIPGATITAESTERTFTATTDGDGNFGFVTLRPGNWVFTASAPGFTPSQMRRRIRELVRNPEVDFFLARGAYGERFGAVAHVDAVDLLQQLEAAEELYVAERYPEAIAAYEALATLVPALTTVKMKLGDAYLMTEQYAEAEAAYETMLAAEVDLDLTLSRQLLYNFGDTRLALQGADGAVGWYWQAHEADPAWSQPLLKLGEIALDAGAQAEARRYLELAVDAEPGSEAQAVARTLLERLPPLQ